MSNFAFLEVHDPRLAELGFSTERYVFEDADVTLFKLRQYAELIAKMVAAQNRLFRGPRETLEVTLRRLEVENILPRNAAALCHRLRIFGNTAVHEGSRPVAEALSALNYAWQLGVWLHRTFEAPRFAPKYIHPQRQAPVAIQVQALKTELEAERTRRIEIERERGRMAQLEDKLDSLMEETIQQRQPPDSEAIPGSFCASVDSIETWVKPKAGDYDFLEVIASIAVSLEQSPEEDPLWDVQARAAQRSKFRSIILQRRARRADKLINIPVT